MNLFFVNTPIQRRRELKMTEAHTTSSVGGFAREGWLFSAEQRSARGVYDALDVPEGDMNFFDELAAITPETEEELCRVVTCPGRTSTTPLRRLESRVDHITS
jgi:hypothetical protein